MATVAQVEANRLNALHSTGPRSDAGKAASRFNALKLGVDARSLVIPGEDPAELEALTLDYRETFHPVGPLEDFLVETLVAGDWNRRRYARIEAQLVRLLSTSQDPAEENPFGALFLADAVKAGALQKVFRRLSAAERSYFRALAELRRAQRERLALEADAAPARPAAVIQEIGFVSPPPSAAPNSAPLNAMRPKSWRPSSGVVERTPPGVPSGVPSGPGGPLAGSPALAIIQANSGSWGARADEA
jgi:hypothetical protein